MFTPFELEMPVTLGSIPFARVPRVCRVGPGEVAGRTCAAVS